MDRFRWGGVPLLAGPSSAPFDPANVLFLALPLGTAMKAWLLLHLAVLVAGFAAFARRLGLAPAPAAVAGLVFALSGTTVSLVASPPTLSALSVLPWFAAFVLDAVREPSPRAAAKKAAAAALVVLASAPEFVLYAGGIAVAIVAAAPPVPEAPRPRRGRALIALGGALVLAAGSPPSARFPRGPRDAQHSGPGGMGEERRGARASSAGASQGIPRRRLVADWTRASAAPGVRITRIFHR